MSRKSSKLYPLVPSFDDRYLPNTNLISHYNDADKAIKYILYKNKLKLSLKKKFDDPIEHHSQRFVNIFKDVSKKIALKEYRTEIESLIDSARIGCFCINKKNIQKEDFPVFNKGYLKSRMWSQYGGKHSGVCLVFDKKQLHVELNETVKNYDNGFIIGRKVDYTNKVINQHGVYQLFTNDLKLSCKSFLRKNARFFLFTKYLDYKDEQEYRFVVFGLKECHKDFLVNIESSLVGIICGYNFHQQYIPIIKQYSKKHGVPAFKIHWSNGIPRFERLINTDLKI